MPRALRAIGTKNRSKPGKCERRESNPYTQTGNRNLNPARLPISPLSLTKSSAKPPQRQTAAATLYTHALRLMQVFFASPRFLPLFGDALCRCRSIRAFFWGRALYVAIAPYELGGALSAKPIRDACSYAIARKRPIRSAIALLPAAIRALARSMSLSLHTSSGGG